MTKQCFLIFCCSHVSITNGVFLRSGSSAALHPDHQHVCQRLPDDAARPRNVDPIRHLDAFRYFGLTILWGSADLICLLYFKHERYLNTTVKNYKAQIYQTHFRYQVIDLSEYSLLNSVIVHNHKLTFIQFQVISSSIATAAGGSLFAGQTTLSEPA